LKKESPRRCFRRHRSGFRRGRGKRCDDEREVRAFLGNWERGGKKLSLPGRQEGIVQQQVLRRRSILTSMTGKKRRDANDIGGAGGDLAGGSCERFQKWKT